MQAKFRGWLPNVTGNLSFSLIGGLSQPSPCELVNVISDGRRVVACSQTRNLSDNLITKKVELPGKEVHSFHFTLLSRTGFHDHSDVDCLAGWVFIHIGHALEVKAAKDEILAGHRTIVREMLDSCLFGIHFRLYRDGRCAVVVPPSLRNQDVEYGAYIPLSGDEALRPLAAQCFYFLRDITHRHQHHSPHSDTLTSVWSAEDGVRWVRETLYELFRRVIISRRIRSPKAQEDALGILAYIGTFEEKIAVKQRAALAKQGKDEGLIPKYNMDRLRDSLNSSLEVKRRRRTQRNVVAAAVPAFFAAFLALGNLLYPRGSDWTIPKSYDVWMEYLLKFPLRTSMFFLGKFEWIYIGMFCVGILWILSFAEILTPANWYIIRTPTQVVSPWGKVGTVIAIGVLALLVTASALKLLF